VSDLIEVDASEDIAMITFNRPDKHNALTIEMFREIPRIFGELDADQRVKVIVVRGAGERAFASGADIAEFRELRSTPEDAAHYNLAVAVAEDAIEASSKPTIAHVHGYCIGGGCGVAVACDFRLADTKARFAITPARLGIVYSVEPTKRLYDLVGPAQAKLLLMTGRQITAQRAHEIGLVEEVHEPDHLADAVRSFAESLCRASQVSIRTTKDMVRRVSAGQSRDDSVTTALREESYTLPDYAEGVSAFLEKRAPEFTWRG